MSEAKHTPGPWTVGGDPDMDYDPLQLGFYKIFAVDGIGEANAHEDFIAKANVNFRSHEANARLIAAAPELLEALRMWMDIHEKPAGFAGKYGKALDAAIHAQQVKVDAAAAAARAAIAKATGGCT